MAYVDPKRSDTPEGELVVVDRHAGTVGREVKHVVAIAERELRVGAIGERDPSEPGEYGVVIPIVEGVRAVALKARERYRVARGFGPAGRRRVPDERPVRAASHARLRAAGARARSRPREDLDDPRHRVGAIQHARGSAHDLDSVDL